MAKTKVDLEETMSCLLCSAFEGGSNYWYFIEKIVYPEGKTAADFRHSHIEVPLQGGSLEITAQEHDNKERADGRWTLDRKALEKGWQLMITDQPHHYADAVTENGDAITGDVFLQLCLFGEVIFG